uniref:Alpha-2-macroglobulin receptor-associated protein n=1 Tax=Macaca fascicularis TaxID=9541 RepID=A0A7N9C9G8_MACFA
MASRRLRSFLRGLPALLLLMLFLLGPWPAASHGGKYSREKNQPEPPPKRESGEEFRMEKLNQLWEKAQRLHLPPVRLAELHADLKIQERDELAWKKLKLDGLDKDGEKEARLIRNLNVILAKYGLDGKKDAQQVTSNSLSGTQEDGLDDPRLEKLRSINQGLERLRRVSRQGYSTEAEFEEPRVIDLWDLAQSANLTDKELEALRELKHFEAKIEKHNHYQKQLEIAHEKLR